MLQYWANVFAMLGVALVATAFFRLEDWQLGIFFGACFIFIGAWFHGLAYSSKRGK